MTSFRAYDSENIFDLTIRVYGNINGLSGLINQVTSIDDNVTGTFEAPSIVFTDYVAPEQPETKTTNVTAIIGESQSIYDLATQMSGKLSGLSDIIGNYTNLDNELKGETFTIVKNKDPQLDFFLSNGYVFATKSGFDTLIDSDGETLIDSDLEEILTP